MWGENHSILKNKPLIHIYSRLKDPLILQETHMPTQLLAFIFYFFSSTLVIL